MNKTGATKRLLDVGTHLFRNKRNENKYIVVAVYGNDGHYYYKNFMHWDNGVTNPLGTVGKSYRKIHRQSLSEALSDYEQIPVDYTILP